VALVERRIGLLFAAFLVLLVVAGGRALWLGGVRSGSLASAATSQQVSSSKLPAERGSIVDRKGNPLAVSEPASDVSATPYLVKDPVKAAERLAPVLGQTPEALVQKLARKDTGFVFLARNLPAAQAARVQKLNLTGIDLEPGHLRFYPREFLAAQLLGSVGTDGRGLSGIEYERNKTLTGTDGERRLVKDALGQSINVRDTKPAHPGNRIELTIDAAIQDEVERVLTKVGQTYRPKGATAIVLDPRDSEVLAMANWPRIDANDPGAAPAYAAQNRAVGATYEPGSTFKAVTVAGALEENVVKPDSKFVLPPQIQVADRTIGESHPRGTEQLSTAQILAQSSNVGSSMTRESIARAYIVT